MEGMSDESGSASGDGKTVHGVFKWEMVRKALRAAEEGAYCWEIEDGHIYYTEQCMRMLGLPLTEWAPNIFTETDLTIHAEDRQFFSAAVQRHQGSVRS